MDRRFSPRGIAAGMLAALSLASAAYAGGAPTDKPAAPKAPTLSIRALSSRPDMVSGGDALIEVRGATKGVKLAVNGKDASGDLRPDPASHSLRGLVSGLTEARTRSAPLPARPRRP
jgi:Tannase-like family of unknown function (DUF6351)